MPNHALVKWGCLIDPLGNWVLICNFLLLIRKLSSLVWVQFPWRGGWHWNINERQSMIVLCLDLKLQANVQSPSTSFPLAVNPDPLHVFSCGSWSHSCQALEQRRWNAEHCRKGKALLLLLLFWLKGVEGCLEIYSSLSLLRTLSQWGRWLITPGLLLNLEWLAPACRIPLSPSHIIFCPWNTSSSAVACVHFKRVIKGTDRRFIWNWKQKGKYIRIINPSPSLHLV